MYIGFLFLVLELDFFDILCCWLNHFETFLKTFIPLHISLHHDRYSLFAIYFIDILSDSLHES